MVDFGATSTTGIHVLAIENLRKYYGLEQKPVRVTDPYQMLGEIAPDLVHPKAGMTYADLWAGFDKTRENLHPIEFSFDPR